jgi:hypothetical protein
LLPSERLFVKLGKKEDGAIGPDLFRRDYGGLGANKVEVTYEPTLDFAFPRVGMVNPVNFDEVRLCFVSPLLPSSSSWSHTPSSFTV